MKPEHEEQDIEIPVELAFEWHARKAAANVKKHGSFFRGSEHDLWR